MGGSDGDEQHVVELKDGSAAGPPTHVFLRSYIVHNVMKKNVWA